MTILLRFTREQSGVTRFLILDCTFSSGSKQLDEVHHRKQELEDEKRANKQKLEQSLYRQRESLEEETPVCAPLFSNDNKRSRASDFWCLFLLQESELASLRRKLHEKQSEQEGVEAQLNDKDSQLQAIDRYCYSFLICPFLSSKYQAH